MSSSDSERYQSPDSELVELARLLRNGVETNLQAIDDGTESLGVDPVFDKAFGDVSRQILRDRLSRMPSEKLAELYAKTSGQEDLLAQLEEIRLSRQIDVERTLNLARLAAEARAARSLRLPVLDAGETINVGLFNRQHPELASRDNADNTRVRPLLRVLQLSISDPEKGGVILLNDVWRGAVWDEELKGPALEPRSLGALGSITLAADSEVFSPELALHSQVSYRFGQDEEFTTRPDEIIGYVETADGTVLLNG